MKAIILVGGLGTRLRPLTLTVPKPLVDFANKPFILHQIEALKAIGISEVILAINYQAEVMLNFLKNIEENVGLKISCSQETEPLGTAGPLALARERLVGGAKEPFFVLNSDIICEFPLKDMIAFHKHHGGEASIMVAEVEDPSKYGVVIMDEKTGKVEKFIEKPQKFMGVKINAGFWMNIGQPKNYISGLSLYLDFLRHNCSSKLASSGNLIGNVLIDKSARIGEGCSIGPDVAIGPNCVIESNVDLSHCTLMKGVNIGRRAKVCNSIIGWNSTIGNSAQVYGLTIIGEGANVNDGVELKGATILPHSVVKASIRNS
ncbi:mannose-1-phosphate guanylyltransferase 1 [Cinnamomum micranthum f. kanehirae]|uniref:mannose-1-phosphate guanylyltransferase n=1 Tax=Cinnamomum micranthum f. kanehirae TaxID=337451 RepID=A0A443P8R2_9MAGN|nr:mannose-1-phosphate guanylyltransferase 1 [Cinnamomum micranthum f. kanehirae]